MGLLSFLLSFTDPPFKKRERARREKQLEWEMDLFGLSKEERRAVRDEGWSPEDFDEVDLTPNDYYHED